MNPSRPRFPTFKERAVWGTCPVCFAVPGQPCHPEVGTPVRAAPGGKRICTGEGPHIQRLENAPRWVQLVSLDRKSVDV